MYKYLVKRLLDIFISVLSFPIVLPLILLFSILIKLEDHGPVFYNGKRIGKNGKIFKMFKLRSMTVNAPDIRLEDGSTFNSEDDSRVTKIGKLMRKTSIDELPQFLNVFLGQMSIIGPRPDPIDWLEKYPKEYIDFLNVRPGITGYNQAYYRNSSDGIEKMKNDLYYEKNCSFVLDCKIFFKTIIVVLKKENTYKV